MAESFEKRNDSRAITDVALELYDMSTHELVGVGRLMNLSLTGSCIETTSDLGGRKDLFVRMLLNGQLVACPADVVWEKPYASVREYGFRFGPFPDEMQEIIRRFMKENIAFYEETDLSLSPPPGAVRKP
jgi:hypothetical protein